METIRRLRAERGWSQQELADRVGVSRQTISAIENNPDYMVRVETQHKLADAFGVPFDEFVYLLSASGIERLAAAVYNTEMRIKDAAARAMHDELNRVIEEADDPGTKGFLYDMHYGVTFEGYASPFTSREPPDYYWPDEPESKNEAPTPPSQGAPKTTIPYLTSKGYALDIVPC